MAAIINMATLTNEEIAEKFKKFGVNIGPVTDSTRNVYLRKLEKLNVAQGSKLVENVAETYSDDRLRAALKLYNVDVGPITTDSIRNMYLKRLAALEKKHMRLSQSEPMDIAQNFEEVDDDL